MSIHVPRPENIPMFDDGGGAEAGEEAGTVAGTAFAMARTCERSCALIVWSVVASRPTRATIDASAARTARSWMRAPGWMRSIGSGYGAVSRSLDSPAHAAGTVPWRTREPHRWSPTRLARDEPRTRRQGRPRDGVLQGPRAGHGARPFR